MKTLRQSPAPRRLVALLAAALLVATVAGCELGPPKKATPSGSGGSAAATAPNAALTEPALAAALAYVSDDAASFAFTNWALALADQPPGPATGPAKTLLGVNRTRAMPAGLLLPRIALLRDTWKFDVFDLAWEADLFGSAGQFAVLQFKDTADLAPTLALFEQRGYTRGKEAGGATIYTHKMDPKLDWVARAPFLMLNVAVFAKEKRLVIGSSADEVSLALRTAGATATPAPNSAAAYALALAPALGKPYGVLLTAEPAACRGFAGSAIAPAGSAPVASATPASASAAASAPAASWPAASGGAGSGSAGLSAVGPTLATAIGFSAAKDAPPVTIALLYPDAASALRDVHPRIELTSGVSIRTGQPYMELVMGLSNVRAVGPVLLFDGRPRDDRPQLVLNAWTYRDLPFAACP